MIVTVVATLCHMLPGISAPVCREEIVTAEDMSVQACVMSQAALAEWKGHSIYKGPDWTLQGYKCSPGTSYVVKDAT